MQTFRAPGVYVLEDQSTPMPLSGVPTGIPCFFGFTEKGRSLKPTRITSFNQFRAMFGGRPENKVVFRAAYIEASVYNFFLNGGSECYVCRVNGGKEAFWAVRSIQNVVDYERLLDEFDESSPDDDPPAFQGLKVKAISGGSWANKLRLRICASKAPVPLPMTPTAVRLTPPPADHLKRIGLARLKAISDKKIPAKFPKPATLTIGDGATAEWKPGEGDDKPGAFEFEQPQTKSGSGKITTEDAKGLPVVIPVTYVPDTSFDPVGVLINKDTGAPFSAEDVTRWNLKTRLSFDDVQVGKDKKSLRGSWDPESRRFFFIDGEGTDCVLCAPPLEAQELSGELAAPLHLRREEFRLTFDLEILEPVPPRNPGDAASFRAVETYQGLSTDPDDPKYFLKAELVNGVSMRVELEKLGGDDRQVAFGDSVTDENRGATLVSPLAPGGAVVENKGDDSVPPATEYASYFQLLKAAPDVSLIACPDAYLDGETTPASDYQPIYQAAIDYAFDNRCMVVIDPPPMPEVKQLGEMNTRVEALEKFVDRFRSTHAAVYAPWFSMPNLDPLSDQKTVFVPPSGFILGAYNRSDNQVGVWKAPANMPVQGAVKMQLDFTEAESEALNPAGVNLTRSFPGQGMLIWGARTTTKNVMWRYVNVRRLFLYVERTLKQQTMWAVFESNDRRTWNKLVNAAEAFLRGLWRAGGLMGTTPEEAFRVSCGVPETMTMTDVYNGLLKVEVKIAPVRPAEFVVFTVSQLVQPQQT